MSYQVSAGIILGWPIEIEKVWELKNKFDENTGEPYEKQIETDFRDIFIGHKKICAKRHCDECHSGDNFEHLKIQGTGGYEEGQFLIGILFGEVDATYGPERSLKSFSKIEKTPELIEFQKKHLLLEPSIHLYAIGG